MLAPLAESGPVPVFGGRSPPAPAPPLGVLVAGAVVGATVLVTAAVVVRVGVFVFVAVAAHVFCGVWFPKALMLPIGTSVGVDVAGTDVLVDVAGTEVAVLVCVFVGVKVTHSSVPAETMVPPPEANDMPASNMPVTRATAPIPNSFLDMTGVTPPAVYPISIPEFSLSSLP